MKCTLEQLRSFVSEALVKPSKESKKKDDIAKGLQELIVAAIKSGRIKDQNDLDIYFSKYNFTNSDEGTLISVDALTKVPFEVWKKLSQR